MLVNQFEIRILDHESECVAKCEPEPLFYYALLCSVENKLFGIFKIYTVEYLLPFRISSIVLSFLNELCITSKTRRKRKITVYMYTGCYKILENLSCVRIPYLILSKT